MIIINACSFNKDSSYWLEDNIKRVKNEKEIDAILKKSNDITLMSYNEYKLYIDDYTKKSKDPKLGN